MNVVKGRFKVQTWESSEIPYQAGKSKHVRQSTCNKYDVWTTLHYVTNSLPLGQVQHLVHLGSTHLWPSTQSWHCSFEHDQRWHQRRRIYQDPLLGNGPRHGHCPCTDLWTVQSILLHQDAGQSQWQLHHYSEQSIAQVCEVHIQIPQTSSGLQGTGHWFQLPTLAVYLPELQLLLKVAEMQTLLEILLSTLGLGISRPLLHSVHLNSPAIQLCHLVSATSPNLKRVSELPANVCKYHHTSIPKLNLSISLSLSLSLSVSLDVRPQFVNCNIWLWRLSEIWSACCSFSIVWVCILVSTEYWNASILVQG